MLTRKVILTVAVLVATLISGCTTSATPADPDPAKPQPDPTDGRQVGFMVVDARTYYEALNPRAIRVEQKLPGYAVVDLGRSAYLVLISIGQRSSSGYAVAVRSVEEIQGTTRITVEESQPKPGEAVTTVVTHPYVIVQVQSASGQFLVVDTDGQRFSPLK